MAKSLREELSSMKRKIRCIQCNENDSGGGIQSIQEGENIAVDSTDPLNPIVSATGGSSDLTLEQARLNGNVLEGDVEVNKTTITSDAFNLYFGDLKSDGNSFGRIGFLDDTSIDIMRKEELDSSIMSVFPGSFTFSVESDISDNNSILMFSTNGKGLVGNQEFNKQGDRKAFAQLSDVYDNKNDTLNSVALRGDNSTIPISVGNPLVKLFADSTTNNLGYGMINPLATGVYNVVIGTVGLQELTTGYSNMSIGSSALGKLTTGNENVAIGPNAGYSLTSAIRNLYIGSQSGRYLIGNENVGIGWNSARGVPDNVLTNTGTKNTCIGISSLYSIGSGNANICLGHRAGYSITSGSDNIIIGSGTAFQSTATATSTLNIGGIITGSMVATVGTRAINIDGKLSITPIHITTADETFTKNIVAKPDGTFGWEDRGKVIDTRDNSSKTFWTGSQAQYDTIVTKDSNTIYIIL